MNPLRTILILIAIAAAFGGGWYVGQQKSGGASASSAAAAPSGTEAQYLQTYGWIIGQQAGVLQLGLTPAEIDQIAAGMKLVKSTNPDDVPGGREVAPKFEQYMNDRVEKMQKAEAAKQDAAANKFFADLDKNPKVKKTSDGLYYEIIEPGSADKPGPTDEVTVNYKGTFIDGKVFDQTEAGQPPAELPLNHVVPGWTEGLQLIGKGGKIKLYIPGKLGYGENPPPRSGMAPNATLIFDVELVNFGPAKPDSGIQGMTQEDIMKAIQAQMGGGGPPPGMGPPPTAPAPGGSTPPVSSPPVAAPTP